MQNSAHPSSSTNQAVGRICLQGKCRAGPHQRLPEPKACARSKSCGKKKLNILLGGVSVDARLPTRVPSDTLQSRTRQVGLQGAVARGVFELGQGLVLNLPDTLTGHLQDGAISGTVLVIGGIVLGRVPNVRADMSSPG